MAHDDRAISTSLALQVSWERQRPRSRRHASCSSARSRRCSVRPTGGAGCRLRSTACCATGISVVSALRDRTALCAPWFAATPARRCSQGSMTSSAPSPSAWAGWSCSSIRPWSSAGPGESPPW
eukprot:9466478-Pyramimonas_sp.AAC.1